MSRLYPDEDIVGEGPMYEDLNNAAKEVLREWHPDPSVVYQETWGLGNLGTVKPDPEDKQKHLLWVSSMKRQGLGTVAAPMDLKQLKATAIGLLLYCVSEEEKMKEEL